MTFKQKIIKRPTLLKNRDWLFINQYIDEITIFFEKNKWIYIIDIVISIIDVFNI